MPRLHNLTPEQLRERIDHHLKKAKEWEAVCDYVMADKNKSTAARLGRVLAEVSTRDLFGESEDLCREGGRQHPNAQSGTNDLNGEANRVTAPEAMPSLPTAIPDDTKRPWAKGLRKLCYECLVQHGGEATADEIAARLGKSPLAIRPRFSELETFGAIIDTGRRRNDIGAGKSQKVWRAL